ncbi:DMT family transporter [Leucobacter celer]|uniref:DMT family transporter n=1 Tax=Leucobacter celer TaxID=668625 RepID=UPI0006A758F1|nr:DMT family transporter [Leucobacter celer]
MTNLSPSSSLTARTVPVLMVAITVVLWASAFVVIRAVGEDFAPGALALGRLLVGAIALTVFVAFRAVRAGAAPRLPGGRTLGILVLWGAAWFGGYNLALNAAELRLDAGTTALLVNVSPLLVGLFAGLLLGEGFPARLMVGMSVALLGVVAIASATWTGQGDAIGVLLALLAALLYAGSVIVQKRLLIKIDALTVTWLGCLVGAVVCAPFAPELIAAVGSAPASSVLGVVYLGVFPTAIAFVTWGYALSRMSAGRLAASTYVVPPLVVLMSWLLLAESPAILSLVGGAVCLAGVAVATFVKRGTGAGSAAEMRDRDRARV